MTIVSPTHTPGLVCVGCNRAMRRRGVKAAEAPDTIAYAHSGKCNTCVSPARQKNVEEKSVAKSEDPARMLATVTALEQWMRINRGVQREAKNPIKYQREAA